MCDQRLRRGRGDRAGARRIGSEFKVEASYHRADMTKGADRRHDRQATADLGARRHPDQQRRIQFVSPIEEFPLEKWDQIIAINLSAAFHAIARRSRA